LSAFFLPMSDASRFCLLHEPHAGIPRRGAVLFVHAMAEEMNKSRHMAALQSRAFADAGWTTLQLDLYGCGDSAGDFSDASWDTWLDDIAAAYAWLERETGKRPMIWGIRTGCLLGAQAAARLGAIPGLLCWQPVASGKQYLQQFLRLKAASELVAQPGQRVTGTKELREALDRGETVEIAGYALSPALASGLERAELDVAAPGTRIAWFEVRGSTRSDPSPAAQARVRALEARGHEVAARVVQGPSFWDIVDAGDCPALIAVTLAQAQAWHP
jgi:exosortase A-associated hydrolase 2